MNPVELGLVDLLPAQVALVDGNGAIFATNQSWEEVARVGELVRKDWNYLDECTAAVARGCSEAQDIRRNLEQVLSGEMNTVSLTYSCPFDGRHHWYQIAMRRLPDSSGAVLMHIDVTALQHDPLTGLPNRALFDAQLDYVINGSRQSRPSSLLVIDLDGFKEVNDTLGHLVGDQVLTIAADRLRAAVRATDLVARLGGDEFAVVLAEGTGRDDTAVVAERIADSFDHPFAVGGAELRVGASIGAAHYPIDGNSAAALITAADLRMYSTKRNRRTRASLDESPS